MVMRKVVSVCLEKRSPSHTHFLYLLDHFRSCSPPSIFHTLYTLSLSFQFLVFRVLGTGDYSGEGAAAAAASSVPKRMLWFEHGGAPLKWYVLCLKCWCDPDRRSELHGN